MSRSEATFRIGEFFLTRRSTSPNWYAGWFDRRTGQTRRRSLGTQNIEEAKRRLADHAVANETMENLPATAVPLAQVLGRYYDEHARMLASEEAIRHHLRRWVEHYGNATVAELTPRAQEKFVTSLQSEGLSAGYIRRLLGTGRAALQRAHRRQELSSVPFVQLPPKEPPDRQAAKLEPAGMAALLEAAAERSDHLLLFCIVSMNTLARPEAVLELTVDQLNFDDRCIDLNRPGRRQTRKYRPVVPMTNAVMPWLRIAASASVTGRVIEWQGRPVKSIRKAFKKACREASLSPDVTPYSIRHTIARELRRAGVAGWEVAGMLGHRTEGTTEVYAEFSPDYRAAAAGAVDQYNQTVQSLVSSGGLCITFASRTCQLRASDQASEHACR